MIDTAIEHVAEVHGLHLQALPNAAKHTDKRLSDFREYLAEQLNPIPAEMDVLLLGSFGRSEVTQGSDCDYLVVIGGMPDHRDVRRVVEAVEDTRHFLKLAEPGKTGTFGDFVTATELFGRIGLEGDSNSNTTRRLLLLSESVSILAEPVSKSVRDKILDRYLMDYRPDVPRTRPVRVPHFLLNDLTRYWRTIAVDFGAKQWRSLSADWYLRYAKLLTTRKVLFAGTLAVLFTVERALAPLYTGQAVDREALWTALHQHVSQGLIRPPLARLMALHDDLTEPSQQALASLLKAYEEFFDLISDEVSRDAIRRGGRLKVDPRDKKVVDRVESIGLTIHESLVTVFYDDPLFKRATREFGLF